VCMYAYVHVCAYVCVCVCSGVGGRGGVLVYKHALKHGRHSVLIIQQYAINCVSRSISSFRFILYESHLDS
jgi:hypothetical protein